MMVKKRLTFKTIDIIYWMIIFFNAIGLLSGAIKDGSIDFNFEDLPTNLVAADHLMIFASLSLGFLFCFSLYTIIAIIECFHISILYFGLKIALKKFNKEKLSKIDFKNDNYYREILPNFSPGMLSYVDDFKIDEKDIVSTLMKLELKGKIKITDKIELLDSSEDGINYENEKFIFSAIKNNSLKNVSIPAFENTIVKDCLSANLLEEKGDIKKNVIKKVITSVFTYIAILVLFNVLPMLINQLSNNDIVITFSFLFLIVIFLLLIIYPFSAGIYIKSYYFMNKINPYIRNKEANEINEKLEGLKKYMKDYSNMNEREKEELTIWEDYLIYSVMFGENPNIVEKVMKIIQEAE